MSHPFQFAMVCPQRSLSAELLLQELAQTMDFCPKLYSPSSLIESPPDAEVLVILNYSLDNPKTRNLVRLVETNFTQFQVFLLLEQIGEASQYAAVQRLVGLASQQYSLALLSQGFNQVAQGGYWLPRSVMEHLLSQRETRSFCPDLALLSKKENQVVEQLSAGLTNDAIARNLGVSTNTVKTHLQSVYRKLGVANRCEALARVTA